MDERELLLALLSTGDDYEVTSHGGISIKRLGHRTQHPGEWRVQWATDPKLVRAGADPIEREVLFTDIGEAVDRFLAIRENWNARRGP